MADGKPLKEGWVQYRHVDAPGGSSYLAPMKKSYGVLYGHSRGDIRLGGRLAFYPSQEDYNRNPSRYKGIPMELLADVTEGGLDENKGFTLDVVGDPKKYFLLVETKNERLIWLTLLRGQLNAKESKRAHPGARMPGVYRQEASNPEATEVRGLRIEQEASYEVTVMETDGSKRCHLSTDDGIYCLEVHQGGLRLKSMNNTSRAIFSWAFIHIRRFGTRREQFMFEAGSRCASGEGIFAFHTHQERQIMSKIEECKHTLESRADSNQPKKQQGSPGSPKSEGNQNVQPLASRCCAGVKNAGYLTLIEEDPEVSPGHPQSPVRNNTAGYLVPTASPTVSNTGRVEGVEKGKPGKVRCLPPPVSSCDSIPTDGANRCQPPSPHKVTLTEGYVDMDRGKSPPKGGVYEGKRQRKPVPTQEKITEQPPGPHKVNLPGGYVDMDKGKSPTKGGVRGRQPLSPGRQLAEGPDRSDDEDGYIKVQEYPYSYVTTPPGQGFNAAGQDGYPFR